MAQYHLLGVACPEIVPRTAKHGRQFREDLLHLFPAFPLVDDLPNPLPEFLRRLRAWPPLHEMSSGGCPPLLANRASQEYEALLTAS